MTVKSTRTLLLGLLCAALFSTVAAPLPARAAPAQEARATLLARQDAEPSLTRADTGLRGQQSHKHRWVTRYKKEWVPPRTQRVRVGTDRNGRPIYRTKVIKPGYWRRIPYSVCTGCGARRG